jgi:hypothetical protein
MALPALTMIAAVPRLGLRNRNRLRGRWAFMPQASRSIVFSAVAPARLGSEGSVTGGGRQLGRCTHDSGVRGLPR